jgi:hypothetical protein
MTVIGRCCSTLSGARFGEAVGGQLFALQGVDFVAEAGQADFAARGDEGQRQAGFVFRAHAGITRGRAGRG